MERKIEFLIADLLFHCDKTGSSILPTELYNETWLHRVALQMFSELGIKETLLSLEDRARWHSEGRLASPFLRLPRSAPGGVLNNFADGYTRADAVLGHFRLLGDGQIKLKRDATQFVVGEAKLGSPLTRGVTNDKINYNQAARTLACMAHLLSAAGRVPIDLRTIGFYVVAPAMQIEKGIFSEQTRPEHIKGTVRAKVDAYRSGAALDSREKRGWFDEWLVPMVDRMQISVIAWEDIVSVLKAHDLEAGQEFEKFYHGCLRYCRFYTPP